MCIKEILIIYFVNRDENQKEEAILAFYSGTIILWFWTSLSLCSTSQQSRIIYNKQNLIFWK